MRRIMPNAAIYLTARKQLIRRYNLAEAFKLSKIRYDLMTHGVDY